MARSRSPLRRTVYHSYSSMSADCHADGHAVIDDYDDKPIDSTTHEVFCTMFFVVFCLLLRDVLSHLLPPWHGT